MLFAFFIIIHILISIGLVLVILMQAAKGGGLAGGAFGGAASQAVFGGRQTATFLSRATVYLAVGFLLNCLVLAMLSKTTIQPRSVTQEAIANSPAQALPLAPEATTSAPGGAVVPDEGTPPVPEGE